MSRIEYTACPCSAQLHVTCRETRAATHPTQSYSAHARMGSTGSFELMMAVRIKKALLILWKHSMLSFLNRAESSGY